MLPQFSNLRISKLYCRRIIQVLAALVAFAAISQCDRASLALLAFDETQNVTCRLLDIKREPATAINASEDGNWIALRMGPETGLYDIGRETGLYSTVQRKVVGSWPHGSKVHSFVKRQVQDLSGLPNRKPDTSSNDYVALVITLEHVEVWSLQPFERIAAVRRSGIPREREHQQPKIAMNSDGSLLAVEDEKGSVGLTREPKVRVFSIRDNPYGSTPQFELEPMKNVSRELPPVGHIEFIGNKRLLVSCYMPQKAESESFIYSADTSEFVRAFPKNRDVIGSKNGRYFVTTVLRPDSPYSEIAKELPVFTVNDTMTGDELASIPLEGLTRAVAFHPTEPLIAIALGNSLKEFDFRRKAIVFEKEADACEFAHVKYGLNTSRLYALEERSTGLDDDVDCKLVAWETGTRSPVSFPNENLWHLLDFSSLFFTDAEKNYVLKQSANQSVLPFEVKDIQTGASLHEPVTYQAAQKEVQYSADGDYLELESVRIQLQSKRLEVKWGKKFNVEKVFPGLNPVVATLSPNKDQWLVVSYASSSSSSDRPESNSVLLIDDVSGNPGASHSRISVHCGEFVSNNAYILAGGDGIELRDSSTGEVLRADRRVLGQSLTISVGGHKAPNILVGGANAIFEYSVERFQSDQGWSSIIDGNSFDRFDLLHPSAVTCSAWNGDCTRFAIGHLDGSIGVYDAVTKQKTHQIGGIRGEVFAITFDPSGKFLLSASESGLGVAALKPVAEQEAFAKQLEVDLHSNRWPEQDLNVADAIVGMNGKQVPGLTRIEVGNLNPNWESARINQRATHRIVLPPLTRSQETFRQPRVASVLGDVVILDADVPPVLIDDQNQTIMDLRTEVPKSLEMMSNLSSNGKRLLVATNFLRSPGSPDGELRLFDVDSKRELFNCKFACSAGLRSAEPHPLEDLALLSMQDGTFSLINAKNGNGLGKFKMSTINTDVCLFVDQGKKILGYRRLRDTLFLRGTHSLDISNEIHVDLPIAWVQPLPDDQHVLIGQDYLHGVAYVTKYNVENCRRVWSHAGCIGGSGLFSKNGRWYLSVGHYKQWSLWDLDTPEEKLNIQFPDSVEIQNASVADDGTIRWKHDNSVLWSPKPVVVEKLNSHEPVPKPVKEEHIPGTATLKIRVVYRGEVPKLPVINTASDPVCANLVIPNETLIVGKEGAIQNAALIWDEKKNPKFKAFDKDNKWRDKVVELKCKDCRFEPHVLVMRAGQKIKQVIVDQTGHSANFGFFNNQARGFLVPVGKPIIISVPESEPTPVPIECNVHPWMKAHLIVQEHPYIGVSNAEGIIEIDNLPIGENVFRLWHEALAGPMDKVVINGKEQAINRGRITFKLNEGLNDLGTLELQDNQFKIDTSKK